ncbi:type VI secretion system tube protein TssD [Enterobacter asburiae]|uniref:type VI secretion system tube protein TssD n=1 Tax=Enterobacter asburiae TaxID=61645 RepID=UPI0021D33814|nr:type VI secretion system tube protein TssD [Enterobacter asburiae]MCU6243893.1 type VI secretion system tube protein Hcp [Enterobacter asburiae]
MSDLIYMKVKGATQDLISKGASSFASIGNKGQVNHKDECYVCQVNLSAYADLATNIGHMSLIKLIDRATPLLSLALSNGEELNLEFSFYRHTGTQSYELYFKTFIEKAYVTQQNISMGNDSSQSDIETLMIRYGGISHKHVKANTHGYIDWFVKQKQD